MKHLTFNSHVVTGRQGGVHCQLQELQVQVRGTQKHMPTRLLFRHFPYLFKFSLYYPVFLSTPTLTPCFTNFSLIYSSPKQMDQFDNQEGDVASQHTGNTMLRTLCSRCDPR